MTDIINQHNSISTIDFLNKNTDHKITFSNVSPTKSFFNRVYSYLSQQLFFLETQQTNKYDKDIKEIYCCKTSFSEFEDDINTSYDILSVHYNGKKTCNIEMRLSDMDISIKYSLPRRFYKIFKNECIDDTNELIVEYTIYANTRKFSGDVVEKNHISEYNELTFHPKNKLSLKYFDLFISGIINHSMKKDKHYLTKPDELTVYINVDSYWEELFNRPKRHIDHIYLPKEDKQKIIKDLEWFMSEETQRRYEQLGRNYKRVVLFEGIPGSGKTSMALALASHFGYDLAIMSFTDKVSDGTFTRLIRQIPEKTILLLEDIDCLFHERKNNDSYKNELTFSGILNTLDGISTPHNFICIITTNYKNLLDDAILRQGRIDNIISFTYIKQKQLKEIYKVYMGNTYDDSHFNIFYQAYKTLNTECTVSLIQEYLFKYLDNPQKALENIHEIKELNDATTHKKANVYT